MNEEYFRKKIIKGKSLLEWAIISLSISSKEFYNKYKFEFNIHKYKGLYDIVRQSYDKGWIIMGNVKLEVNDGIILMDIYRKFDMTGHLLPGECLSSKELVLIFSIAKGIKEGKIVSK